MVPSNALSLNTKELSLVSSVNSGGIVPKRLMFLRVKNLKMSSFPQAKRFSNHEVNHVHSLESYFIQVSKDSEAKSGSVVEKYKTAKANL